MTRRKIASPLAEISAPVQSNLVTNCPTLLILGASLMRTAMAVMRETPPSGILAMNTALQPKLSTTTPARIGPMIAPRPTIVMNMPMTRPRC